MSLDLNTIAKLAGDGAVISAVLWKLGALNKAVEFLTTGVNQLHAKVDHCATDIAILKNHDQRREHAEDEDHHDPGPK